MFETTLNIFCSEENSYRAMILTFFGHSYTMAISAFSLEVFFEKNFVKTQWLVRWQVLLSF